MSKFTVACKIKTGSDTVFFRHCGVGWGSKSQEN